MAFQVVREVNDGKSHTQAPLQWALGSYCHRGFILTFQGNLWEETQDSHRSAV